MKYLVTNILLAFTMIFLPACKHETLTNKTSVEWNIEVGKGDLNQPISKVAAVINGKSYPLVNQIDAPMETLAKADFSKKGIPESAVAACSGFWAGYEQVMYLDQTTGGYKAVLLTYEEGYSAPQRFEIKTIASH